ncbi:geranylgeranyl diphosphate synthase CrtE [Roseofilum casamattae]|uniref:Polyprenyl synthetase family protein n=1 Tax=Roseofilum casamattae BLCC-M143 TaxID=3022442 RepID=A0ABT7C254_9CYAN|nr:farnesyl diphosphate synthase [Roseofilum casamattae]MDJ1185534.1 polyprenyl synthetase family protein [Roseofilum casamattae BLCC-M143]
MVLTNDTPSQPIVAFDLTAYLRDRQQAVEAALERALPLLYPETIYESMRYSLLAGGKRLRPILCLASCELAGGTMEMAMPTACAMEMLHTMSLIHDDLPAMDNDDYRRGKLTNHKVYGDDIAILAGDGLLTYAFEHIADRTQGASGDRILQVIVKTARAVGAAGLVGGQVVDLLSEGKPDVDVATLNYIHTHKTGALLEASVVCGALLAGATETMLQHLGEYAKNIGLAFQIVDDILDITATSEQLGKTSGKDLQAQKVTYPSLWGIEKSREESKRLIRQAKAQLQDYGDAAQPLLALADFITARSY